MVYPEITEYNLTKGMHILFVYANDRKYGSDWAFEDWLELFKVGGGRVDTFCEEELDECRVRIKVEDEIKRIAALCSMYPYKKYGGIEVDN